MPSAAQFEIGSQHISAVLDGYGKLHEFTIFDGQLCIAAQMMQTDFYKESVSQNKVAPSLLFEDTVPPSNTSGLQKVQGPNDNTFVNTMRLGDDFYSLTDSQMLLKFDPTTLDMLGLVNFTGQLWNMHPIWNIISVLMALNEHVLLSVLLALVILHVLVFFKYL
jgi:carotenoid cleavage dioxygenase-like enzyme